MSIRLVVNGRPLAHPSVFGVGGTRSAAASAASGTAPRSLENLPAAQLLDRLQLLAAYDISAAARSAIDAQAKNPPLELDDHDIVEWELEDGFRVWTSVAAYQDELQRDRPELFKDGIWQWAPPRRAGTAQRGIAEWKTRAIRFLKLEADEFSRLAQTPRNWPDELKNLFGSQWEKLIARPSSWAIIKALTWLIESQLTPGPGLYLWPAGRGPLHERFRSAKPLSTNDIPVDRSILVCLHGTASSTMGSFGYLNTADPKSGDPEQREWGSLSERFGQHIYAWEHRTLGESPIDNALGLAKILPVGAKLNLLSHSRGGLVGDLLCLPSITPQMRDAYSHGLDLDDADEFDQARLQELDIELQHKQFKIEQFARVACPARGTLLASENIERFLSLLLHLIGLIPGLSTSATYNVLKRIVLEVAKNRTNAKWIPGIAAMVPDSPLVRMLNIARESLGGTGYVDAQGELGIIAGDWGSRNAGLVQKLLVPISDLFVFGGVENDWVVNTESMFLGARRKSSPHFFLDRGGNVSHFNYFANPLTRSAVTDWLLLPSTVAPPSASAGSGTPGARVPAGFQKVATDELPVYGPRKSAPSRGEAQRVDTSKPLLFFVPDLFGSQLVVKDQNGVEQTVWLDMGALARGGLGKLSLSGNAAARAPRMETVYESFCDQLRESYDVVECPYDWRRSIEETAASVLHSMQSALADSATRAGEPREVRVIAHGVGALVVARLAGAADGRAARNSWSDMLAGRDVSVLMLGAPHDGMADVAAMLTGFDVALRRLGPLDPKMPLPKLLDWFAQCPGLLELLPDVPRWFAPETWQRFRNANQGLGGVPSGAALRQAQQSVTARRDAAARLEKGFFHVLGSSAETVCDVRVDGNRLCIESSDGGDGRVLHRSSILPKVDTYYVDANHGDLAIDVAWIPAYRELLETGRTSRLLRTPPAVEQPGSTTRQSPPPVLFPTRGELVDALFARRSAPPNRAKTRQVKLSVLHGDLRYAKYPVMVGHYEGDTISGSERYLDKKLRGQLVDRYRLGLYPGPLGTSLTVVPHVDRHVSQYKLPVGALVIGLGRMGAISSNALTHAVRDGLIEYALEMSSRHDFDGTAEHRPGDQDLGVSLLLIGSQTAATLTLEDCVNSLLRGVALANQDLERSRHRPCLRSVEIVELFLDSAIAALNAAVKIAPVILQESETEFVFEHQPPQLNQHDSGRMRIDPLPTSHTWRRWEVTALPPAADRETVGQLSEPLKAVLREALRKAPLHSAETRAALFDLAFPGSKADDSVPLGLRFVAMADRARAERKIEGRQRPVIDHLIRQTIDGGVFKPDIAKALYELLIPNDLKDSLAQLDRLVMVLDQETAAIPWELLVLNDVPLATQIGFVRQLLTDDCQPAEAESNRRASRVALPRAAFVVGNPLTEPNIPSLDGAQSEAQEVAKLLQDSGFAVEDRYTERAASDQVIVGLLQRPYRVLHLAGHGYFARGEDSQPVRYGMLLNNNQYLTAQEIRQLPQVPNLVFLNCCHLAGMDGEAKRQQQFQYSKLASSIARELIGMGVRAVVAAGWAVRDDLAKTFATKFYQQMLAGEPFGEAVRDARIAVWHTAGDSNTWAAYQAYGDPDYRLTSRTSGRGGHRSRSSKTRVSVARRDFVAPQQIVEQLRLVSLAGQSDDVQVLKKLEIDIDSPEAMLELLVAACPPAWMRRVDVLAAFGHAHAQLGKYARAVDYYRLATETPPADDARDWEGQLTFQTIEQLANCETREAWDKRDVQMAKTAISRLELLCKLGETPERLSLCGAARKTLAAIGPQGDAGELTEQAYKDYCAAVDLETTHAKKQRRKSKCDYPLSNAIALQIVRDGRLNEQEEEWLQPGRGGTRTGPAATATDASGGAVELNYWDAIAGLDREFLCSLRKENLQEDVADTLGRELAMRYLECWDRYDSTPRQIHSSVRQFAVMYELMHRLKPNHSRVAAIRALLDAINRSGVAEPHPLRDKSQPTRKAAEQQSNTARPGKTKPRAKK